MLACALLVGLTALIAGPAAAQTAGQIPALDTLLQQSGGGAASGRIVQLVALITVLSVAPGLLIMTTSFTRFVIAFAFLRSGLGLQSTPANLVLISLSLFMTFYVMAPTFDRAWQEGVKPLTEQEITEEEAFQRIADPFRDFMLAHVRPKDLQMFADLAANNAKPAPPGAGLPAPAIPGASAEAKVEMRILIPAFMISELRRGFEIGFLIVLPFLIIDLVVATLVMSMGMMMMPPAVISLPFKVLFFILIDGWSLLVGSLVRSFY
ncbi:flagellar type III secretion system pore protein FliP [Aquabacter spiritensis]|uniref:Flagellar biosynthetic protein FliP n=1 Tax=Aquabacter spiritensis TaxID=933073 RepID=A0A4R3M972_9HYPH|nr:flagellar type III secretion system pore protein FliP [Aquabacter spiritensis]TCT07925.1 flagellar biosynthetic protein FliP [Aquabacter spiritensis]